MIKKEGPASEETGQVRPGQRPLVKDHVKAYLKSMLVSKKGVNNGNKYKSNF